MPYPAIGNRKSAIVIAARLILMYNAAMDLLLIKNMPEMLAARTSAVRQAILARSRFITQGNFDQIDEEDLSMLLELYDREFFDGWLGPAINETTGVPLRFRLSGTMTFAGGKTIRYRPWRGQKGYYEIAIAGRMLFMSFRDEKRAIVVCGRECSDRLDALQRIFEHELIHLAEMLSYGESSCSGPRFKKLARNIFGHTDTKHALVTPREDAAVRHGVKVGSMVEFVSEGRRLSGRINRISRRATVLVADPSGVPYTDGGKYLKYYVPLKMLTARASAGRSTEDYED